MAAPAFGSIGSLFGANTSTPAFAVPASVASNDVIVVAMFADVSTTTITGFPTGFAEAENSPVTIDAGSFSNHTLHVAWKRASAADTGTYTFTLSGSTFVYGNAVRYTGCVTSGNPWDSPTSGADGGSTASTTNPDVSVTTLGPDRMLVYVGTNWGGDSGTWTAPSGFNQRQGGASVTNCEISDLVQAAQGGSGLTHASNTFAERVGSWLGALIGTTVASGSIPPPLPRYPQYRDYGEVQWSQGNRLNANLVATAANALPSPLDVAWQAGGLYSHLYGDVAARPSLAYFGQKDRRDPTLLTSIGTDPLTLAAGVGGDTWRRYNAPDFADRREVPQQRAYISDPLLLGTSLLENVLLGGAETTKRYFLPATTVDRREVPQQRAYISDPLLLGTSLLENALLGGAETAKRYFLPATTADRREVPQQRAYVSDPLLLGTSLLENELLGGAETTKRYFLPATTVDRREVPQQRAYLSDPLLLGTALLENEMLGGAETAKRANVPVTHAARWWMPEQPPRWTLSFDAGADVPPLTLSWGVDGRYSTLYSQPAWQPDRRQVPQQRSYISDPSFYPLLPPTDPLTVTWGAGGTYWHLYWAAATHTDRREVPQQRAYVSDPLLLGTSLLENELLGGADDRWRRYGQWPTDRREAPQQRAYISDPTLLAPAGTDPLTLAAGVGGDTWRRYTLPVYADRREVLGQRGYISDPSLLDVAPTDPLTLAAGVGGDTWRRVNSPVYADRREAPQQRSYVSDPTFLPQQADPFILLGDVWRRYSTPAYADRREVPQQPPRWSLSFDAGPGLPPLTLAWGAGGSLWHSYRWRREARSWWPPRLLYTPLGQPCIILRPSTGRTTEPSTGATVRPSTGITDDPCNL